MRGRLKIVTFSSNEEEEADSRLKVVTLDWMKEKGREWKQENTKKLLNLASLYLWMVKEENEKSESEWQEKDDDDDDDV